MSIKLLTGLFGKTRQAYYKLINQDIKQVLEEEIILEIIKKLRKKVKTSRWGVRKIHSLIKEDLRKHSIKMGRDKLFDLLRSNNMLVKPRKRHFFTTQSHHWLRKYEYLIENMTITGPNQLWVSDITYVYSEDGPLYLYLITDAYSQKIVGWYISSNLKAESAVIALRMALKNNSDLVGEELIHHSDRGVQYCSKLYVEILKSKHIKISMTHPGSPQENSIAERINGILKNEWIYDIELKNYENAKREIKGIVKIYNEMRPHQSLNYATPNQIHEKVFSRHKTERVIGKQYSRKKTELKKDQSQYAIGSELSLTGCSAAEPASVSSDKTKLINKNVIPKN